MCITIHNIRDVCEAILGYFVVLARDYLATTLDYIVIQMRKINCEKGYIGSNQRPPLWSLHQAPYCSFRLLVTPDGSL